jgi:hypothetical protein
VIYGPNSWRPARRRSIGQAQAEDLAEKLRREGAIINIQVAVPASLAQQLQAQGKPVPPPQNVRGMVDTGASISTVSEEVAAAAGLQTVGTVPLYGVGGGGEKPVFATSFTLTDYGITVDPLEVGGVTINMPGVDILIGRDILKAVDLAYRGGAGQFDITTAGPAPAGGAAATPAAGLSTGTWIAIGGGALAVALGALFALDVI